MGTNHPRGDNQHSSHLQRPLSVETCCQKQRAMQLGCGGARMQWCRTAKTIVLKLGRQDESPNSILVLLFLCLHDALEMCLSGILFGVCFYLVDVRQPERQRAWSGLVDMKLGLGMSMKRKHE